MPEVQELEIKIEIKTAVEAETPPEFADGAESEMDVEVQETPVSEAEAEIVGIIREEYKLIVEVEAKVKAKARAPSRD